MEKGRMAMDAKKLVFGALRTAAVATMVTGAAAMLTSTSGCSEKKHEMKHSGEKQCGGEKACGGEKGCGGGKGCAGRK
jgi:hypothetical protein